MFGLFGKREVRQAPVEALFARVAEASRLPALYLDGAIADDFEGRFESLTLHVFLVLRRLRELPSPADEVAQDLVDANFAYLELGCRNGGVSDTSVPKRMKKIGQMFYGRVRAYEAAFAGEEGDGLTEALARNATPQDASGEGAAFLAAHARRLQAVLEQRDLEEILTEATLFAIPMAGGER
jgi:cytochrome b pre-mRNA-processing protein 3